LTLVVVVPLGGRLRFSDGDAFGRLRLSLVTVVIVVVVEPPGGVTDVLGPDTSGVAGTGAASAAAVSTAVSAEGADVTTTAGVDGVLGTGTGTGAGGGVGTLGESGRDGWPPQSL
jgi:hypothetical protein